MSDPGRAGAPIWRRLRLLVIVAWCGTTWAVGYVVAPVLFRWLPSRILAGDMAGGLFRIQAWMSVVAAVLLLLPALKFAERGAARTKWLAETDTRLVLAMLVCTVLGYFALQPQMNALRAIMAAQGGAAGAGAIGTEFAIVHGVSAVFYLGHSLLGAWLVMRQAR